jgi:hypothetical protein
VGGVISRRLRYALGEIRNSSFSNRPFERERTRASPGEHAMHQLQPQGAEPDHLPLSDVIERNIQNQVRLRIEAVSGRTFQERMANTITATIRRRENARL